MYKRQLKTRKPVTLEQTFRTGKQALITSTPHFDSSGEITMIITVVRDMTETVSYTHLDVYKRQVHHGGHRPVLHWQAYRLPQ